MPKIESVTPTFSSSLRMASSSSSLPHDPPTISHVAASMAKNAKRNPIFISPVVLVKKSTAPGLCIGHNDDHGCGYAIGNSFICYMQNLPELNPTCMVVSTAMQEV